MYLSNRFIYSVTSTNNQMRFNARGTNDGERFKQVTERVTGKRVTYKELTGKLQDDDKLSC